MFQTYTRRKQKLMKPDWSKIYCRSQYFRGTKISRIGAHVHIRDTKFSRTRWHLYEKKTTTKNTNNAQRSSRYNNAGSAMEALSVNLPGLSR